MRAILICALIGLSGCDADEAQMSASATGETSAGFGVATAMCNLATADLGGEVGRIGAGRNIYRLYDSDPGAVTSRAFYVTGFSDNCPRRVAGALVLFGAPALHERLRYSFDEDTLAYSVVDEAYERIKARICRVRRGEPCSASRIEVLERSTAFLTAYESFGDPESRFELLLSDGEIIAQARP